MASERICFVILLKFLGVPIYFAFPEYGEGRHGGEGEEQVEETCTRAVYFKSYCFIFAMSFLLSFINSFRLYQLISTFLIRKFSAESGAG